MRWAKIGLVEAILLGLAAANGTARPYEAVAILCGGDGECRKKSYSTAWIAARNLVKRGYATWAREGRGRVIRVTEEGLRVLEPYYSLCGILNTKFIKSLNTSSPSN